MPAPCPAGAHFLESLSSDGVFHLCNRIEPPIHTFRQLVKCRRAETTKSSSGLNRAALSLPPIGEL